MQRSTQHEALAEDGLAAPEVVSLSIKELQRQNKEKRDAAHAAKAQRQREVRPSTRPPLWGAHGRTQARRSPLPGDRVSLAGLA